MRNRWPSDDWKETIDGSARIAAAILIIGSACSLVLTSVMLAYRFILVL